MHINDVRTRKYDQACPVNAHMVYVDHVAVYVRSNTPPCYQTHNHARTLYEHCPTQ